MTDLGMKEVANPSAIFLQRGDVDSPGSIATVTWEGTRPLLVELQALVDDVAGGPANRVPVGLISKDGHAPSGTAPALVSLGDQDVFANVVGGVRITGPVPTSPAAGCTGFVS